MGCHFILQGIFSTQGSKLLLSPALTGGFFTNSVTWEAHCGYLLMAYLSYWIGSWKIVRSYPIGKILEAMVGMIHYNVT